MNRRSIILTLGLLISGYLVIFGEKPESGVSEPVVRNKADSRADKRASHVSSASSKVVTSKTFNRDGEGNASANRQENQPETRQEDKQESRQENPAGNKKASASTQVLVLLPRDTLIDEAPDALAKPGKSGKPDKKGAVIAGLKTNDKIPREALFDSQTWDPPPPPPPKPGPPPPPVAPPLPYVFIGKKLEDQTWEVYLTRGEQTFFVREKGTLEGQYRVDSIKPPTMTLTYLPLNQTQTLTIGGND